MKNVSVTYNGLSFDAEFGETTAPGSNGSVVDKTLAIPVSDQSAASFEELPDKKGFYFGGNAEVSGEYFLTDKAPGHYIFTNK